MTNKTETIFCKGCGARMTSILEPAEKFADFELYKIYPTTSSNPKYDKNTGKRNYVKAYTCPNRRWWNSISHDSFAVGKLITE